MRTRQLMIILMASAFLSVPALATARHSNYGYNSWPDEYARTAVKQAQKSYRHGCGFHGTRWTSNYNDHRRWAARHSVREGEREIHRRNDMLNNCHGHYGGNDQYGNSYGRYNQYAQSGHDTRAVFANYYATTAVKQARRNIRRGCGYYGERWTTDYNRHYRYAYKTRRYRAESELDVRERLLNECR